MVNIYSKFIYSKTNFHFFFFSEGSDWLGTWSRHMKPICFKVVREYQKVRKKKLI